MNDVHALRKINELNIKIYKSQRKKKAMEFWQRELTKKKNEKYNYDVQQKT